ncbi:MAG: DUF4340 domain-containing protein [Oscillospiraceae bacterium]|nr:DUF4340 domain-containing protein [Oscillospiraceae bacterium]
MKQKNFLKTQTITVIILATIAVMALLSYFFIVAPMNTPQEVELPPIQPREVIGGEHHVRNERTRRYDIFMLQRVPSDNITEISVFNGEESWSFIEHAAGGHEGFVIARHEGDELIRYIAPYNFGLKEQIISLFGGGTTLDRLELEGEINFDTYGLGEGAVYVTLYQENGDWHRIYVGDRIPAGAGYYARFVSSTEGERLAVYVVASVFANLANNSHLDVMLPILSFGAPIQENFVPDSFRVYHGRELYLEVIRYSQEEVAQNLHTLTTIVYQGDYSVYAGSHYINLMEHHLRNPVQGLRVVAAAPLDGELTAETFSRFGIHEDTYRQIVFQMPGAEAVLVWWIIGEEIYVDGSYFRYVYSPHHEIIVEVSAFAPAVQPAFWSLGDFANHSIYLRNIFIMSSVAVNSLRVPDDFYNTMGALRINETFNLTIGQRVNPDGSRDPVIDRIIMTSTGSGIPNPSDNLSGVFNFQRFMTALMSTHAQHGVQTSADIDLDNPHFTITITLENGETDLLAFYFYSAANAFFRLNNGALTSVRTLSVIYLLEWVDNVMNGIDGRG